jgi:hypothetical protein
MPSQLSRADGLSQAVVAPSMPHLAVTSKLYFPPPAPQHASNGALNPVVRWIQSNQQIIEKKFHHYSEENE